jgi:hypothetical protein
MVIFAATFTKKNWKLHQSARVSANEDLPLGHCQ